jgi:hypothetical protein
VLPMCPVRSVTYVSGRSLLRTSLIRAALAQRRQVVISYSLIVKANQRRQTGPVGPVSDFDDRQGQVYRAPSQAGPGNGIDAGSPGFQKAPTWGPASLVAIR